MSLMGSGLDRLGNRYTAVLSGAGGVGAVKAVSDLDTRFTYLGIQAGKTTEEMDALKRKIFEVAQAPDIRVDPAGITDAIGVIIEKTGNMQVATDNIRNIGLAMRATQAAGKDVGGVVAQFFEKAGITDHNVAGDRRPCRRRAEGGNRADAHVVGDAIEHRREEDLLYPPCAPAGRTARRCRRPS